VTTLADFKGLKIWASPGVPTIAARQFGAVPVQSEYTQLYEYISKGTADAIFISPGSALGGNVLGHVKSMTTIPGGLASTGFFVFMSEKKFNSLNKQQQDAILRAAEGLWQREGAALDGVERVALSKMKDVKKATFSDAVMAEMHKSLGGPLENWKKRAKAKGLENPDEVLAFYRASLAEVMSAKKK
jgi:TRAP-type C4-dicarboxylate transport system substrate-binding protein